MKVYAEYFTMPNGVNFRKKTLLHFGYSTDLIGSTVLMNPGSSKPIGPSDDAVIKDFYSANHSIDNIDTDAFHEFSVDPTMSQLEKIFNGWYIGEHSELNGIIQLFNCFYYRSPDLNIAMSYFNDQVGTVFDESNYFLDKPVYFGWGNHGKYGGLKKIASDIFSNYNISKTPVYDSVFENNSFYHPGYVNRSYKKMLTTKELMKSFWDVLNHQ